MAGLGSEAVVPIRPDLATNLTPINFAVEQNAVAAVSDAFRQGQISANDIIERYSVLNKTKEKAKILELDEFISPQAIQTRQNQQAAINTEAILKSSPEYIAMQEATTQALFNKANEGDYGAKQEVSRKLGFFDGFDPAAGWTAEQKTRTDAAYRDAVDFNDYREQAKTFLAGVKPRTDDVKTSKQVRNAVTGKMENVEVIRPRNPKELYSTDKYGRKLDDAEIQAAERAVSVTANQWKNSGRAASPFGEVPGKVAPPVTPVATGGTRITENKVVIGVDGTRTESNRVEEELPPAGVKEDEELPASETKITPVEDKPRTEKGFLAAEALPFLNSSRDGMERLKKENFDPTSWKAAGWNVAVALLPDDWVNPVTPDGRKLFEGAVRSFNQGMLRLVSGASIAPTEHGDYRNIFFPMPRDPAWLVQEKEKRRVGVARITAQLSSENRDIVPGSPEAVELKKIDDWGKSIDAQYKDGEFTGTPGATSTQAGGASTVTPVTGGSVGFTPGKGYVFTAGVPSTNAAPVVTPRQPFFFGQ